MDSRKILISGGMLLILSGLIYAIGYLALFSQALEKAITLNLELALDTAVKGKTEIARSYVRELAALENRRLWHWLVIGHLIGAGLTVATVSSLIRGLALKKKWEKILSCLLLLGGALSAFGYFAQLLGYSFYGWGISALGYIWQAIGIAGFIFALVLLLVTNPGP